MDDAPAENVAWACIQPKEDFCGSAAVIDGKLVRLSLAAGSPVTLEQAVGMLGPPTYIGYDVVPPLETHLQLIWVEKGIVLRHREPGGELNAQLLAGGKVPRKALISDMEYTSLEFGMCQRKNFDGCLPWPGF